MEIIEIIKKLTGKISPTGESGLDKDRLENLKSTINLIEELQEEVIYIARFKDSHAHSEKEIGKVANDFITEQRAKFM